MLNIFTAPWISHSTLNHYLKVIAYYIAVMLLFMAVMGVLDWLSPPLWFLVIWGTAMFTPLLDVFKEIVIYHQFNQIIVWIILLLALLTLLLLIFGHRKRATWYGQGLALAGLLLWTILGFLSVMGLVVSGDAGFNLLM